MSTIDVLKRTVAAKAVAKHRLIAGFVPAGSFMSQGPMSAFSKNLSAWIGGTAPTEAIAVVLIGFPDLEPDGGDGDGDGNPMMSVGTCRVYGAYYGTVNGVLTAVDGSCPAGQNLIKMLPRCPEEGAVTAVPEIGAAVTYGQVIREEPNGLRAPDDEDSCRAEQPGNEPWAAQCRAWFTSMSGLQNRITNSIVTINNVTVAENFCARASYEYRPPYWGRPTPFGAHTQTFPAGKRDALCCTPP